MSPVTVGPQLTAGSVLTKIDVYAGNAARALNRILTQQRVPDWRNVGDTLAIRAKSINVERPGTLKAAAVMGLVVALLGLGTYLQGKLPFYNHKAVVKK
jgi:hypothetical protein